MKPGDLKYFHALTTVQIGGMTAYLEAAVDGEPGMIAQSWVVMDRVDHPSFQGNDVATVCYHEAAFSCYLSIDNPEYPKAVAIAKAFNLYADPTAHIAPPFKWTAADATALRRACQIFADVMGGKIASPFSTNDVFMYFAAGTKRPAWADKLAPASPAQIGRHLFFRGR